MNTLLKSSLLASLLAGSAIATAAETQSLEQLQSQVDELELRIDAIGDKTDSRNTGENATTIGGYGELHYNKLDNRLEGGNDKNSIDFHRFVLFFGHDFDASTRLFTELELEHALAGDGAPGEVELEQAYVE
ncbi:MAG TPA: porin, partial [Gammaproteobacteria bacterium]